MNDDTKDIELLAKAKLLKASRLFSPRGLLDPLDEQQVMFLALAGAKPVSIGRSGHWVKVNNGGHTAPDDPAEVADLLKQLGLRYEIEIRGSVTFAYVSLDQASLDALMAAENDHLETGRWLGYPMTAVEAFAHGESMLMEEQKEAERVFGSPVYSTFRLSRTHAREELGVMRHWRLMLENYDMVSP